MPIMVLFVVFFEEICSCSQILTRSLDSSLIEHVWAVIMALISYSLILIDFIRGKITKRDFIILFFLFSLLLLYAASSFIYRMPPKYFSYLLVFIAESIPAAYIGMRFVKSDSKDKINNLLPFFIVPVCLLIGTIGVQYAAIGERVNNDDSGLNYQKVAYFMAFSYAYASYYVFYVKDKKNILSFLLRSLMILMMFFCAMVCLVSGGRGAFVFIIVVSLYLTYIYMRNSKKHRIRSILIIVIVGIITIWLIDYFHVMESAGMARVMDRLTEDDKRMYLYDKAYNAFRYSPLLGNGIGSVWWTVGFYSHNMIMDLLSEGGIIGTSIILIIIFRSFVRLYRLTNKDEVFLFFILVMTGALVRSMFSNYWVAAINLFLVCSMVYGMSNKRIKKIRKLKNK